MPVVMQTLAASCSTDGRHRLSLVVLHHERPARVMPSLRSGCQLLPLRESIILASEYGMVDTAVAKALDELRALAGDSMTPYPALVAKAHAPGLRKVVGLG